MHQAIVVAIAVFVACIAIEWSYGRIVGRDTYSLDDTIGSLSQGLLSQCAALCTPLLQIGLYTLCFSKLAIPGAAAWWSGWYGWILAVVSYDFCDYWLHRVSHERAIFWAAHVVHHQSRHFNFSTALRQESAYAVLGWMFYLPMAVIGVPPEQFAIAGLVVLMYQFWIHTEHIGKLGWFDRVFSSPSNHRVHHATNDRYIDRNYGAILVVWDRLFGSFEEESEPCVYGTREPLDGHDPMWAFAQVYWGMIERGRRMPRWRDRLRMLLAAPGWLPAGLESAGLEPHQPHEPPAPRESRDGVTVDAWRRGLACLLMVGLALSLCAFLWTDEDRSLTIQTVAAALAAAELWIVGRLLSGRIHWLVGSVIGLLGCYAVLMAARMG